MGEREAEKGILGREWWQESMLDPQTFIGAQSFSHNALWPIAVQLAPLLVWFVTQKSSSLTRPSISLNPHFLLQPGGGMLLHLWHQNTFIICCCFIIAAVMKMYLWLLIFLFCSQCRKLLWDPVEDSCSRLGNHRPVGFSIWSLGNTPSLPRPPPQGAPSATFPTTSLSARTCPWTAFNLLACLDGRQINASYAENLWFLHGWNIAYSTKGGSHLLLFPFLPLVLSFTGTQTPMKEYSP